MTSTLALAAIGADHGEHVLVIAPAGDPYRSNRPWISAAVRAEALSDTLGRAAWWAVDRRLGAVTPDVREGHELLRAADVPAAVRGLPVRPSLLVVNSMRSLDLGRLVRFARATRIPLAWYLRETSSLKLVERWGPEVGVLIANSEPLAAEATARSAQCCHFIPSFVDPAGLAARGVPTKILLINPIHSHGLDIALAMATALPGQSFVLQESWPLDAGSRRELASKVAKLSNVEVRERCDRGELYRDARVLLALHIGEDQRLNRPRVALEAQYLGIPCVGADTPGLRSVAASPELLVPVDAPPEAWVAALERAIRDHRHHVDRARRLAAADPGLDSTEIWCRFEAALH